MAKKRLRSNRECYVLQFADEQYSINWTTGNLARFLRNLFNCNDILQDIWPKLTAKTFALKMHLCISNTLKYNRKKYLEDTANFYLVPRDSPYRNIFCGTIYRKQPQSVKCLK